MSKNTFCFIFDLEKFYLQLSIIFIAFIIACTCTIPYCVCTRGTCLVTIVTVAIATQFIGTWIARGRGRLTLSKKKIIQFKSNEKLN